MWYVFWAQVSPRKCWGNAGLAEIQRSVLGTNQALAVLACLELAFAI